MSTQLTWSELRRALEQAREYNIPKQVLCNSLRRGLKPSDPNFALLLQIAAGTVARSKMPDFSMGRIGAKPE